MSVLQELCTVLQRGRLPKVTELVNQAITEANGDCLFCCSFHAEFDEINILSA
ncbi:MAG: hypothetical protein J6A61_03335 [Clostridia bacterium]|nr:hypothetical protein [Clostridia bacterium]